jgi:hypothetical protein
MTLKKHPWIKRFLAYGLGDLRVASELFDRDLQDIAAAGAPSNLVRKTARARAIKGVRTFGISASAFFLFIGIDARLLAERWPLASAAWLALGVAAALLFGWRYYTNAGQGWRLAWYRYSGNPAVMEPAERSMRDAPLRGLRAWKLLAALCGAAGWFGLVADMLLMRYAPFEWASPWYWVTMGLSVAVVSWPEAHLACISRAYHYLKVGQMLPR